MPVSISEAAAALGFRSRSTIYRLLKQGHLKAWEQTGPAGERLLELEGLQAQVQRFVRLQANTPSPKQSPTPAQDWWKRLAPIANSYLDLEQWGPPPWNGHQWASLVMVASMAADET